VECFVLIERVDCAVVNIPVKVVVGNDTVGVDDVLCGSVEEG
jgi:hypothetical protein